MHLQRVPQYWLGTHGAQTTGLALPWENPNPSLCYTQCQNCHATPTFCPKIIIQGSRTGSCRASCTVLSSAAQLISGYRSTTHKPSGIYGDVLCSCHLDSWPLLSCHLQGRYGSQKRWVVHETLILCYCSLLLFTTSSNIVKAKLQESATGNPRSKRIAERMMSSEKKKGDVKGCDLSWAYIQKCQTYTLFLAVKELPCFINKLETFHHGIVLTA